MIKLAAYLGFESTYEELKQTDNSLVILMLDRFESTYEELKQFIDYFYLYLYIVLSLPMRN